MKRIQECRACGSKALTHAFSLTPGPDRLGFRKRGAPADYVLCDPSRYARACGLLQLGHGRGIGDEDEPLDGAANGEREHLRAAATEALEILSGRDCAALDIGCADGALLSYYPRWVERYGIDPAAAIEGVGAWATTTRALFPSAAVSEALAKMRFDIVTAISVFELIDDPRAFLRAVKAHLAPDGVFVLETLYAPVTLTRNGVDALVDPVSAAYSLSVLEWLIRASGLKIFKGELTGKSGGSIRLFVTHAAFEGHDFDPWSERLAAIWDGENALAMRALQPYQSFDARVESLREELRALLSQIAARDETVFLIGAGSRERAMMDWLGGAARAIGAAIDARAALGRDGDAPARCGPAPTISETQARVAAPDYLLALPYQRRETLERWREAILLGAKMIFASPQPEIVTAQSFATAYAKAIAEAGESGAGGARTLRAILAASGAPRLVAAASEDERAATAL